jgi:hypothetical protein
VLRAAGRQQSAEYPRQKVLTGDERPTCWVAMREVARSIQLCLDHAADRDLEISSFVDHMNKPILFVFFMCIWSAYVTLIFFKNSLNVKMQALGVGNWKNLEGTSRNLGTPSNKDIHARRTPVANVRTNLVSKKRTQKTQNTGKTAPNKSINGRVKKRSLAARRGHQFAYRVQQCEQETSELF